MNKNYLETYLNSLIASTKSDHSTSLQNITNSKIFKNSIYRFLSSNQFCKTTFD